MAAFVGGECVLGYPSTDAPRTRDRGSGRRDGRSAMMGCGERLGSVGMGVGECGSVGRVGWYGCSARPRWCCACCATRRHCSCLPADSQPACALCCRRRPSSQVPSLERSMLIPILALLQAQCPCDPNQKCVCGQMCIYPVGNVECCGANPPNCDEQSGESCIFGNTCMPSIGVACAGNDPPWCNKYEEKCSNGKCVPLPPHGSKYSHVSVRRCKFPLDDLQSRLEVLLSEHDGEPKRPIEPSTNHPYELLNEVGAPRSTRNASRTRLLAQRKLHRLGAQTLPRRSDERK